MRLRHTLLLIFALIAGYSLAGCSSSLTTTHVAPCLAKSPWPKSLGDAQNTAQGIGHSVKGILKWQTDDSIIGSPVIGSDGTVYAVTDDNNLCAFNQNTGRKKWSTNILRYTLKKKIAHIIPGHEETNALYCSPVMGSNGLIYIGSIDRHIHAIDAKTGAIRWSVPTSDAIQSSGTITPNGLLIIGLCNGKLTAYDCDSGLKKWDFYLGCQGVQATPAIGTNGFIYINGYKNGHECLFALDSKGKSRWQFQMPTTGFFGSPVVGYDGNVYIGSTDIYALNGMTGTKKWVYHTGGKITGSMALSTIGILYVSEDFNLRAIDCKTGKSKWVACDTDICDESFAVGKDGTVYVPYSGKQPPGLQALDGTNGRRKWLVHMNGPSGSIAIGANGTIYSGSIGGFYAVQ